jgi:hypothetical protein
MEGVNGVTTKDGVTQVAAATEEVTGAGTNNEF